MHFSTDKLQAYWLERLLSYFLIKALNNYWTVVIVIVLPVVHGSNICKIKD